MAFFTYTDTQGNGQGAESNLTTYFTKYIKDQTMLVGAERDISLQSVEALTQAANAGLVEAGQAPLFCIFNNVMAGFLSINADHVATFSDKNMNGEGTAITLKRADGMQDILGVQESVDETRAILNAAKAGRLGENGRVSPAVPRGLG